MQKNRTALMLLGDKAVDGGIRLKRAVSAKGMLPKIGCQRQRKQDPESKLQEFKNKIW